MSDGLTRDFPKYTYVNRPVSKYVFEMLDLQVGQQTRLIAAKRMCGWVYEDKVMCTARAWKQRRAFGFCQKFQILLIRLSIALLSRMAFLIVIVLILLELVNIMLPFLKSIVLW